MPVYVYKNLTTGETFEVQQSIKESAWTEHPETGDPVKRIVQPVGIAFKGSGFYVTDSRSGSKGKAASVKPTSNGEASGDAAAKPDAKDGGAKDGGAKNGGAKDTSSSSKAPSGGGSSGSSTSSSS